MSTQKISVSLPESTLYVSGTVNSVAVTWTLVENNVWEATADRAADDKYIVALSIVSQSGQTTTAEFTLYYGILNLITDRTQADADKVSQLIEKGWGAMSDDEKAEFLTSLKGAYNAEDWNRVAAAIVYVAERLRSECGYVVEIQDAKQDWAIADIPTEKDCNIQLTNCETVRNILPVMDSTPAVPTDMDELTWSEANDIEQILLDVNTLIDNISAAWFYSGDLYAGEV